MFRFQSSVFVIFCRATTIHSRYLARLKSPSAILNGTFHSTLLTHCSVHSSSTHPALWSDQRMRLELCRHDLFPQVILYTRRNSARKSAQTSHISEWFGRTCLCTRAAASRTSLVWWPSTGRARQSASRSPTDGVSRAIAQCSRPARGPTSYSDSSIFSCRLWWALKWSIRFTLLSSDILYLIPASKHSKLMIFIGYTLLKVISSPSTLVRVPHLNTNTYEQHYWTAVQ